MRLMLLISLCCGLAWSGCVKADFELSYDSFYRKMTKLQQAQYSDITLGFALLQSDSGQSCRYDSLQLISDIHQIPVSLAGNGEMNLPYDEALKDSKAKLILRQPPGSAPCELQFRLRSRLPLPSTLTLAMLQHYRNQFEVLLDDMAGLSRYWLPDVSGVIVQFAATANNNNASNGFFTEAQSALTEQQQQVTQCVQQHCRINLMQYTADNGSWTFSQRPVYLVPYIAR